MSLESLDIKAEKAADAPNGGAPAGPGLLARFLRWLVAWLTSLRLTLWLLAILAITMAVATLIPQNMPREAYLTAFGTVLGPLIAILKNIYGSVLFVGTFALLSVSLVACLIKRAARLLKQERDLPAQVTQQDLAGGPHTRWRLPQAVEEAARAVTGVLRGAGYAVSSVAAGENGQRALVGRRGRLTPWASVVVHTGLVVILLGAAWGRMPRHAYHEKAPLQQGEAFAVRVADGAFGIRLLDAGAKYDAKGHPLQYWAKVQVLEEGDVVRTATIQPNVPLRYHSISATLESILPSYEVEASKGATKATMPVALGPNGDVDAMATVTQFQDPNWMMFVHSFRNTDEMGHEAPQAQVFLGVSGESGHQFQQVGWVGEKPVEFQGVTFRLVPGPAGAQLGLDRDVGVPLVFLGFVIISLGSLLVLGAPRSRVTALVTGSGKGSSVLVRVSPSGDQSQAERLWSQMESGLGATKETGPRRKEEQRR